MSIPFFDYAQKRNENDNTDRRQGLDQCSTDS